MIKLVSFFCQEPTCSPGDGAHLGSTALLPSCSWELQGDTSPSPGQKLFISALRNQIHLFSTFMSNCFKNPSQTQKPFQNDWNCISLGIIFWEEIKLKINSSPLNKTALYSLSGYATSLFCLLSYSNSLCLTCLIVQTLIMMLLVSKGATKLHH